MNFDFKNGVSLVLCNNEKGLLFVDKLKGNNFFKKVPIEWIGGNGFVLNNLRNWSGKKEIFFIS